MSTYVSLLGTGIGFVTVDVPGPVIEIHPLELEPSLRPRLELEQVFKAERNDRHQIDRIGTGTEAPREKQGLKLTLCMDRTSHHPLWNPQVKSEQVTKTVCHDYLLRIETGKLTLEYQTDKTE